MKLKIGKKTGLKYFNINYIRSLGPCYDPNKYLNEDFKGTVIDILNNDNIPFQDRLWVVLRTELVSEKCMRLFAVWSARQVLCNNNNPVLVQTLNVSEQYANGLSTIEELSAARSAAWSAAESAWSAARSAAWSAAESAESAAESARSAAWSAAQSAQKEKLIEMVKAEGLEYVKNKKKVA